MSKDWDDYAKFFWLYKQLRTKINKPYHVRLNVFLDESGSIRNNQNETLCYYRFGAEDPTVVRWSSIEEGLTVLQELLDTFDVSPQAVEWREISW